MNQLKHYQSLAKDLLIQDPAAHEYLEEEINIIIHKLKFIPQESRPRVKVIIQDDLTIDASYLTELLSIAGAQTQDGQLADEQENILLFINDTASFISDIPQWLGHHTINSNAVTNNQVYIIQKPRFAVTTANFLVDTEILAEIVQSKYFHYGHEGEYWIKFDLV